MLVFLYFNYYWLDRVPYYLAVVETPIFPPLPQPHDLCRCWHIAFLLILLI